MENAKHEWCQDVSRDEAVRAAEDAAAVPAILHRDLPEQVALLWASLTDILGRVVRIEGEIDAGEAEEAAPPQPDPASPAEGFRTERVTLEFHIEGSPPTQWPWSYILRRSDAIKMRPGESVRVVEEPEAMKCMTKLRRERDAARAEIGRLRARVAELEDEEAAPAVCAPASPAEGLRTERVTLEVTQRSESYTPLSEFDWDAMLRSASRGRLFEGESVRVVEETRGGRLPDMVAWITAERDAARAECERRKEQIVALEGHSRMDIEREIAVEKRGGRLPDMVAWITAERDAAQVERDAARAEAERRLTMCESLKRDRDSADFYVSCLRARVAELEAATAANAGGGNQLIGLSPAERDGLQVIADGVRRYAHGFIVTAISDAARAVDSVLARHSLVVPPVAENAGGGAKQEPVAWGYAHPNGTLAFASAQEPEPGTPAIVPLYATPPEPRGWLTAEETDAIDHAADIIEDMEDDDGSSLKPKADALRAILARPSSEPRGWLTEEEREAVAELLPYTYSEMQFDRLKNLLARETPPRVKVPNLREQNTWRSRDDQWIAAIREAGGEVQDG